MAEVVVRPVTETRIVVRGDAPAQVVLREAPNVVRVIQAASPFLVQAVGELRRAGFDVGDGTQTVFTIIHNFSTYDVTVDAFRNTGNRDDVILDVARPTTNTVILTFRDAPAVAAFRVLVTG